MVRNRLDEIVGAGDRIGALQFPLEMRGPPRSPARAQAAP